ncbi:decaprenylphospho-beta-D-erythro-pentofuranosid-2-ulose 2-reductase [Oxalobacteraceae bacterium GrIS 2.11]
MKKIVIIGANSAIAEASARIWAQRGDYVFLVARNPEKLEALAADLRVRGGPRVETCCMDVNDVAAHVEMLDAAAQKLGGIDTILIAHGTLSDQAACQQSVELTMKEINTNALSVIALLTVVANRFEQQKAGTIAVISSVAGDRGRQSNYVYGSAKAMVTAFTSGLRQRMLKSGVAVTTIKPGFVDTPMTASFKKGLLWAKPDYLAKCIVDACDNSRDVVYSPWFWYWIMAIIKTIPEFVFKKLSL